MFALVDCNSFYASCERLFRPDLQDRPIVVLSNNDGCAVAMCDKAKALGIRIGTPHFQIQDLLQAHHVAVFSSNYTLYGDISRRVMRTLASLVPALEVYSIDEAFLDLRGMSHTDLHALALHIRETVLQHTGIPTCVGIAPTKALAKAANRVAKKFKQRTAGVWLLDTPAATEKCLRWLEIGDVWGIGDRQAQKLKRISIHNAWQFTQLAPPTVRKLMGVVGLRLQQELQGISSLPLELSLAAKQSICTSRSFGKMLDQFEPVESAVAEYASRCAHKLRVQRLCARTLIVLLQTNPFKPEQPQRMVSATHTFPVESSDTLEIVHAALTLLRQLWKEGYLYKKAGVIVLDTVPENQIQGDLFDPRDRSKARQSMLAMDSINHKYGTNLIHLGVTRQGKDWKLRRELLSPCYSTNWDQMLNLEIDKH